jgi:hypothetical protein
MTIIRSDILFTMIAMISVQNAAAGLVAALSRRAEFFRKR